MSLYSFNDINLIEEKWGDIMDSVEKEKLHHLEPSYTEMTDVFNIICQFIISKQRKIYGSHDRPSRRAQCCSFKIGSGPVQL